MIKNMEQCELDAVLTVADKMVTAAKTAPKAAVCQFTVPIV